MKKFSHYLLLILGILCVGLSVALIITTNLNQDLQIKVQNQQQYLSSGVLGPQGQQITSAVVQEMDAAAATNASLRLLLEKHGLRKPNSTQREPAPNVGGQP